uniref:Phytocyanin domain-containing protein n=1 Tax=Triticum urartu TaxID=4572 RepID=A0A8R7UW84_TRIUA
FRLRHEPPAFCFWPPPCISTSQEPHPLLPSTTSSEATRAGPWPPTSSPCSAGRLFTVGGTLWFASEAAEAGVAEAEFESCEAGDAIRTYTDGLSRVGLDDQGTRYFLSADPAKCKGGLKLRVDVRATVSPRSENRAATAAPAPSASSGTQAGAPCVASGLRVVLSVPGCMNTTIVLCLIGL